MSTRRELMAAGLAAGAAGLLAGPVRAKAGDAGEAIDRLAREAMKAWPDLPGLGLAVVENGEVTLARGYGVRRIGTAEDCDARTLFGIASNTKAFTAAALALLVEDGKVEWDAPVTRYLPEFAMSDPVVTRMMTVRDLLVHRSGLALGAGDLMSWPPGIRTPKEIVAGLRHLPFAYGFRAGYAYDNVLYIVAGEVIAAVSGMPWQRFVETRLLTPIGMTNSASNWKAADKSRLAAPHARLGPPIRGMGPLRPLKLDGSFAPGFASGGICACPQDIAKWLQTQLSLGVAPNGRRIWSEASAKEMWTPQTVVSSSEGGTADFPVRPSLSAYALGWNVAEHRGERVIAHTGSLPGYISATVLLPGRRAGLMVMTNAEEDTVRRTVRYGGTDLLQGFAGYDWIASSRKVQAEENADALKKAAAVTTSWGKAPSLPAAAYAGVYRDPWYGTISVTRDGAGLRIRFDRTPVLSGALEPFDGDTWRTRFDDRAQEDAFVSFEVKDGKVTGARMKAVSPIADFSYDYHDLRLEKVS
jgi:CubicO group peptidase (beta-lactamase class C family)